MYSAVSILSGSSGRSSVCHCVPYPSKCSIAATNTSFRVVISPSRPLQTSALNTGAETMSLCLASLKGTTGMYKPCSPPCISVAS